MHFTNFFFLYYLFLFCHLAVIYKSLLTIHLFNWIKPSFNSACWDQTCTACLYKLIHASRNSHTRVPADVQCVSGPADLVFASWTANKIVRTGRHLPQRLAAPEPCGCVGGNVRVNFVHVCCGKRENLKGMCDFPEKFAWRIVHSAYVSVTVLSANRVLPFVYKLNQLMWLSFQMNYYLTWAVNDLRDNLVCVEISDVLWGVKFWHTPQWIGLLFCYGNMASLTKGCFRSS